ncbi:MAG: hypothetical protein JNM47_02145 [Hyphomonadaceae bacterium]|nr:hypothetical protein [Hyphomonadaceae bacterium]
MKRRDWQRAFREKAQELVPDEYRSAVFYGENQTPMSVFFEVLPAVRQAHQAKDEAKLRSIYTFAAWCHDQPEQDIWNAAGVSFYEHLFEADNEADWPDLMRFMGQSTWRTVLTLTEGRISSDQFERLKLLRSRVYP